jgi:hypothetical protein
VELEQFQFGEVRTVGECFEVGGINAADVEFFDLGTEG